METKRQKIVRVLREVATALEEHPQGDDPRIYKQLNRVLEQRLDGIIEPNEPLCE